MQNDRLEAAQPGIKIVRGDINNLRYEDDTTFMAKMEEELKRLFSSPWLSAIRVVSSSYLRLLIFLLAIFVPGCASSNLAFHMMYSA